MSIRSMSVGVAAAVFFALSISAFAAPLASKPPAPIPPAPKQMVPAQTVDSLFAALAKAHSEEDAKPIEDQLEQAFLQSESPTVELLMARAAATLQTGDTDMTKKFLNYVTDIAPDYAEGWHQLAKLQAADNDDAHALVSFTKAIKLNPREFVAEVELGDMLISYNQKPAALASYRKALALDPHYEGLDKRVSQLAREVEGEKI